MAKCPRCGKEWKWDHGNDIFVDENGESVEESYIPEAQSEETEVILFICRGEYKRSEENEPLYFRGSCNKILGFHVKDEDGKVTYDNPAWKDIAWESPKHCANKF